VAETCHAFALPYICYPTVRSAIAAHYRFLKTMGRRPNASPSLSPLETPPLPAITTVEAPRQALFLSVPTGVPREYSAETARVIDAEIP
jgi:hypothetical protein